MKINQTDFIGSFERLDQCPAGNYPEYAFIGRSNVGKSSLINMLCRNQSLARVSKKPGKTQHLNYFLIEEAWYLVDLPGYGYAQRSQKLREQWDRMTKYYLKHRESLMCVFLLIDINIKPQQLDLDFADWLGEHQIPFVLVFTKADRQKPRENKASLKHFEAEMLKTWAQMPHYFITSSEQKRGRQELLSFIAEVNERF